MKEQTTVLVAGETGFVGFNTILAYTFVRSEFKDAYGEYIPTSWDNKPLFNITVTCSFKNHWDFGFKFRFAGGAPYTPYNIE